jgi:hypothetical protein
MSIAYMTSPSVSYKRHRFPPAIIAQAVWLYFRFPLSLRLVFAGLPLLSKLRCRYGYELLIC